MKSARRNLLFVFTVIYALPVNVFAVVPDVLVDRVSSTTTQSDISGEGATVSAMRDTLSNAPSKAPSNASEINKMLQHLEEKHIYLQTLDKLQAALKKERDIAKLLRECEKLQMVCTGEGLIELAPVKPQQRTQSTPNRIAPRPPDLPSGLAVVGVVGNKALLYYKGRQMIVRRGDKLGGFSVGDMTLDAVVFERDDRRFNVPVRPRVREDYLINSNR